MGYRHDGQYVDSFLMTAVVLCCGKKRHRDNFVELADIRNESVTGGCIDAASLRTRQLVNPDLTISPC